MQNRVSLAGSFEDGSCTLTFPTSADADYWVHCRDDLDSDGAWEPLPGGPHNSGVAVDTTAGSADQRFYLIVVSPR